MRTTDNKILNLEKNQIFVFGSNLAGRHGKGAAKTALKWGAIYRQGEGIQGQTYGIPTKDRRIKTLPINEIKIYIDRFVDFVKENKELTFLVTPIGCGLAGLKPEQIAPLFKDVIDYENVYLPQEFLKILK